MIEGTAITTLLDVVPAGGLTSAQRPETVQPITPTVGGDIPESWPPQHPRNVEQVRGPITPSTISHGIVNTPYHQILTVPESHDPLTFAVVEGALPKGLRLSSDGVIDGTPRETGAFRFLIRAKAGSSAWVRTYTIHIFSR